MHPMTATIRMKAVISNGNRCVVNNALPKSATDPKMFAVPTMPGADVATLVAPAPNLVWATEYNVNPNTTRTMMTTGTTAFGNLSGPDANGATPLLNNAMTNKNNTRIAPLYT